MSNTPNPNRPRARRLVVADWEARERDENTIILDLGDAGEIVIDPPVFWQRKLEGVDRKGMTNREFIALVVGEDQVARWLATGRSFAELDAAFTAAQGLDVGESEASSMS